VGPLSLHVGAPVYCFTPMYEGIGLQYYTAYAAGTIGVFMISDLADLLETADKSLMLKARFPNQLSMRPRANRMPWRVINRPVSARTWLSSRPSLR